MTDLIPSFGSLLPMDVVMYILDYDRRFVIRKGQVAKIVNPISPYDERYDLLANLPYKEFHYDGCIFVYLSVNTRKNFYITYHNSRLQLQTLEWVEDDCLACLNAYEHNYDTGLRRWKDFTKNIDYELPAHDLHA